MELAVATDISRSLAPLRDVVRSLRDAADGHIPEGNARRRIVRRARAAGTAALPALLRSLGGPEDEAVWATYLLRRIGGERVIPRISHMLRDPKVEDDVKARALGLLADLKEPPPHNVVLKDPDALLESSVRDLVGSLGSRAEVRQAVDLILEQVPRGEIPAFVREVLDHGGEAALPLLDALIIDPRTPPKAVGELRAIGEGIPRTRSPRDTQLLEQALGWLQTGKLQRARRQLDALIQVHPQDPELCSALGVCLLEMGQPEVALRYLQRAAEMEPQVALHLWNLSSAARSADQMGACYKSLHAYLRADDREAGAADRRREAQEFCRAYELMLLEAYPGVPLDQVLEGEELFARAYAALSASRYDEATRRFREVLLLVPRHYPSWGNLGAAYLALDRTEEALHCLHRALELNPNYSIARENLALIEQR